MAKRVAKHVFCWCFVLNYDLNGFFEFAGIVLFVRQQTLARIDYLRASEMMVRKNASFCVKICA